MSIIAGIDEAGRGPWAGPVYTAAVILPDDYDIPLLDDSKKLSEKQREICYKLIKEQALAYSVACADVDEIDALNIRAATLTAMQRAYAGLKIQIDKVYIDGRDVPPGIDCECEAVIKGDSTHKVIAAASILAKVSRDYLMLEYDKMYPAYGFAKHKGYGTKVHSEALKQHGPITEVHRMSFKPIKALSTNRSGVDGQREC